MIVLAVIMWILGFLGFQAERYHQNLAAVLYIVGSIIAGVIFGATGVIIFGIVGIIVGIIFLIINKSSDSSSSSSYSSGGANKPLEDAIGKTLDKFYE